MAKPGKAKVLNEAEFKRLLAVAKDLSHTKRNIAILYCSFGLGLRAKELAALNIGSVYNVSKQELWQEINLLPEMTKNAEQRHVYLTNTKVREALLDYIEERLPADGLTISRLAPLFKTAKGNRFSPNSMQQMMYKLYEAAGLVGCSSHTGRRTFATRLIEKGVDIKAVSTLMGHKSIAMTARYVQDNPVRLKKIVKDVI